MSDEQAFVDYYAVLQIDRNCGTKTLEAAYRHLAKTYHPDHGDTADVAKLTEVIKAYRVLRNPARRAEYDKDHIVHVGSAGTGPSPTVEIDIDEQDALDDANAHSKILLLLYKRRRERAHEAGVGEFSIKEMLNCSDEQFEFHRWYLKAKGFIEITEQGTMAITIEGVDHVISLSRTAEKEKLMIAQERRSPD